MLIVKSATKQGFGDSTSVFGFPLPSETCKLIDELLSKTSKEVKEAAQTVIDGQVVNGLIRASTVSDDFKLEKDERADVSLITTGAVDRDFEVVEPKGIDMRSYRKNPIVGFAHDYKKLPVGRAAWVKLVDHIDRDKHGLLAKTMYTEKPKDWKGDWEPDAIFHFVQEGVLKGKSIGFVPTDGRPPSKSDIEKWPELAKARFIFLKSLLVEYSVVGAQSNPSALVQAVARAKSAGLLVPSYVTETLGFEMFDDMSEMVEVGDPTPQLPSIKGCQTDEDVRNSIRGIFKSADLGKIVKDQIGLVRGEV